MENNPPKTKLNEKIIPRLIDTEMQESYLDYAMSVIIARALPDVRDGLKPVHRRVLYSMMELGLRPTSKYRKSATVVGEVLGKYHPHGDMAVYDTLVRMAQNFSMRYPLVDGQGNFGSVDGDQPAAMRYTEVKLEAISEEILADIEKETVNFVANYDATRKEPKVLPSKIPNLLLNGSMGIAVGMATNIPPHNLGEITAALIHLIDNREATIQELMKFIQGPDFPTGGKIYDQAAIEQAYTTGRGSIIMRAIAEIEEKNNDFRIIISEIPFQVNKAELIIRIAELVKLKKIDGVSDIRDESDRKEGIRIVIELKNNAYPKKILNRLYELTAMQSSFHVNMLALVDGIQPKILNLKMILDYFLTHRQEVIKRRSQHDLRLAKDRAHILEGLLKAISKIDEVINTIKKAANREEAGKNLCKKYSLTEKQSEAILEMRLASLAALERLKIEQEYQEKLKEIAHLESILSTPKKILEIIKKELTEITDKYQSERKTKVISQPINQFKAEDLIPSEQTILIMTKDNYIKRMPIATYRAQIRGGKGVQGMDVKDADTVEKMLTANTLDEIYFFTDKGRIFFTKVYEIPQTSRQAKGQAIVNILQLAPSEKVTSVLTLSQQQKAHFKYFIFATRMGIVKKTEINSYNNVRKSGIIAIKLTSDDELIWVRPSTGKDNVLEVTGKGLGIYFEESNIRPMGRGAAGVRGIKLKDNDTLISMNVISEERFKTADILTVSEFGYGKRSRIALFRKQKRGGSGMIAATTTDKTGKLAVALVIWHEEGDLVIVSDQGQVIRSKITKVKRLGRATQGVILMRLRKIDKVASATIVLKENPKEQEQTPIVQKNINKPLTNKKIIHQKNLKSKKFIKQKTKKIINNLNTESKPKKKNINQSKIKIHHYTQEKSKTVGSPKYKIKHYRIAEKNIKNQNNDQTNYWGQK